eukprot:36475-Prymnesium_polylepis.1
MGCDENPFLHTGLTPELWRCVEIVRKVWLLPLPAPMLSLLAYGAVPIAVDSGSYERMGFASSPARPESRVSWTMVLQQNNMEKLKARALAVSTPGDARYSNFLSQAEIDALTAPAPETRRRVEAWLAERGVTYAVERETVKIEADVATTSALLNCTIAAYRKGDQVLLRAGNLSLPADVAAVTDTILGLHGLPVPRRSSLLTDANKNPVKVTPSVLAKTYTIGAQHVNRNGTNIQAVAEFQGQYMSKQDLAKFFQHEVPSALAGDERE